MFKSIDGGDNWTAINTGFNATMIMALAIDPVTTTTLYAGTMDGGLFKSIDGGDNWTAINTGLTYTDFRGLTYNDIRALAIDPVTTTTLYTGTWGGGVFKSY